MDASSGSGPVLRADATLDRVLEAGHLGLGSDPRCAMELLRNQGREWGGGSLQGSSARSETLESNVPRMSASAVID